MVKYVFILLTVFVVANGFSQEKSITTEFSQDGSLYKNFNVFETVLAEFKASETCTVIDYFGKDIYKIKYNDRVGFVDSQYLVVNDEMMDLFYAYQEKESIKTIEAEKKRKDEVQQIEKESEEKRQRLALQELEKKRAIEIIERNKQDSIAKIIAEDNTKKANKISKKKDKVEKEITVLSATNTTNTCDYAMNEFDSIDKVKLIRTEPANIAENLTAELFKRGKNNYIFFNLLEDLGCASYLPNNRSSAKVTLENNKIITFYHSWDMYCGEFNFKANLSNSQMAMLKKSPIKSLKFHGTESSKEITTIFYKTFFIDKLQCIE